MEQGDKWYASMLKAWRPLIRSRASQGLTSDRLGVTPYAFTSNTDSFVLTLRSTLMEELNTSNQSIEFGSLTEIMERFQSVPYEQFQQELQNWFEHNLVKQKGLSGTKELQASPDFLQPFSLVSKIYHQAELLHTISESKINLSDESN